MDTPRDYQDRFMKLMLRRPRMVRDTLALLPADWAAAVDAASLRELPTEFIGGRGDKRVADLCWLAGGGGREPERRGGDRDGPNGGRKGSGGGPVIVLFENQSAPDRLMPARTMTRTGLLYESLGASAQGPDRLFPPVLVIVVYTGDRPWRMPHDLTGLVRVPAARPFSGLTGPRYERLDLRNVAAQYPGQGNRMAALARLVFAETPIEAVRLLKEVGGWLDFGDEDEQRLYRCYVNWFYAITPTFRPSDWDPEREREVEELMREVSTLERNTERWLEGHRRDAFADGRRAGHADRQREALAQKRSLLVRMTARRFGADTGRRLESRLRAVHDPDRLDRVGDLIVDSETGEQLLGGLDGAGMNSS